MDSGNIISDETFYTQSQIMVEKVHELLPKVRELFPPLFDSVCRMFRQKENTKYSSFCVCVYATFAAKLSSRSINQKKIGTKNTKIGLGVNRVTCKNLLWGSLVRVWPNIKRQLITSDPVTVVMNQFPELKGPL